jgi:glutamate 5-kinase
MELQLLSQRPKDTLELQLLSGIGQIKLMKYYKDLFRQEDITIAQILLTHHNFDSQRERSTIRQIMQSYLDRGIVPVINENDMVDKEEFEHKRIFTDNDILAALVAVNVEVDRAIILTDVEGLFVGDPKKDTDAQFIDEVVEVTPAIRKMASRETNTLGLGGMSSKVKAAEMITARGIDTIVACGNHSMDDILSGSVHRTYFHRSSQPAGAEGSA